MNLRQQREFHHRKVLRDEGWDVSQRDSVAFNSGSETLEHWISKCVVGFVLKQQGYRISSEVEGPNGEADVLFYGTEDEPAVVEVETNPTEDVIESKLRRYVDGEPIRECYVLPVEDMPENIHDAREWAEAEL